MLAQNLLGPSSPLRMLRHQRRMLADKLVVLMPTDGYYVQKEACNAMRALGHRVIEVVLGERGESGPIGDNLQAILSGIVQHRPDMLLSINYVGFDRINALSEILEAMALPTAVWFVDHPMVLAFGWLPVSNVCTSLFLWDKSFVPALKKMGAQRVFHLPLATDETVFCPTSTKPSQPLGFVGHSLQILYNKWRRDLTAQEQQRGLKMAQRLLQDRSCLHELVPNTAMGPPIDRASMVLAFACVVASHKYRLELLQKLPQQRLHITGDPFWHELLPGAKVHPSTDYGPQSAAVYQDTLISINATNLQMPSTVNQRLFDVPATRGFLITDNQPEVAELFEVGHGKQIITYETGEQLRDHAAFYSKHAAARMHMAHAAYEHVLAQHTYTHRLRTLLSKMRSEHKSLPLGAVASRVADGAGAPR